jgi:ribosomal protein S18 acetylase RimI-like enzyme
VTVAGDDGGSGNRAETARSAALRRDARILRRALLKAVGTSPDSFMRTKKEVKAQSHAYWVNELKSSTWAVAQRGRKIVGVAAGKLPDSDEDKEDRAFTRYIESVWIKPKFRHKGLGQKLIRYLIEMEYRKNRQIRQFLLWVFATNDHAIKMYEHMGFLPQELKLLRRSGHSSDVVEVKYRLNFDAKVRTAHEDARRQDGRLYGVTFRVLGEPLGDRGRMGGKPAAQRCCTGWWKTVLR